MKTFIIRGELDVVDVEFIVIDFIPCIHSSCTVIKCMGIRFLSLHLCILRSRLLLVHVFVFVIVDGEVSKGTRGCLRRAKTLIAQELDQWFDRSSVRNNVTIPGDKC